MIKTKCQLQCFTVTKQKKLEKRDCAYFEDLSKSFYLFMYFFEFDQNKPLKTLFEVISNEKISMIFLLANHVDSILCCA